MGWFSESFGDFLKGAVGNNLENDPDDVMATKRNLSRAGYFDEDENDNRDNGFITHKLDSSIRRFQRDKNLKKDGVLFPGGETERTIFKTLEKRDPFDLFSDDDIDSGDTGIGFGGDVLGTLRDQLRLKPAIVRYDDGPRKAFPDEDHYDPDSGFRITFDPPSFNDEDDKRRDLADSLRDIGLGGEKDDSFSKWKDPHSSLFKPIKLIDSIGVGRRNNSEDIKKIQQQMADLGFFSGKHTGVLDKETVDGIKKFQGQMSLKTDGLITPGGETLQGIQAVSSVNKMLKGQTLEQKISSFKSTKPDLKAAGKANAADLGQIIGLIKGVVGTLKGKGSTSDKVKAFAPIVSMGLGQVAGAGGVVGQLAGAADKVLKGAEIYFDAKDALDSDGNALQKINQVLPSINSGLNLVGSSLGDIGSAFSGSGEGEGKSLGSVLSERLTQQKPGDGAKISKVEVEGSPLKSSGSWAKMDKLEKSKPLQYDATGRMIRPEAKKETAPVPGRKPVIPERMRSAFDLKKAPVINYSEDRIESLLNNTPAKFEIKFKKTDKILRETWIDTAVRNDDLARKTVEQHSETVEKFSKKHGADPDLVKAIMWDENARGDKWGWNRLLDPVSSSQRPMNIKGKMWSGLIGKEPGRLDNPEENIEASVILIKRISDRVQKPTPGEVASIWNSVGRENTNEFGNDVDIIYNQKPWTQKK